LAQALKRLGLVSVFAQCSTQALRVAAQSESATPGLHATKAAASRTEAAANRRARMFLP